MRFFMTQQTNANQPTTQRLRTLRRWGISWTLIGFLMLLQEAFHFEGALWTMILIIVAWVVIPGPSRTTGRLRGMLELAGIIVAFVIVLIGSIYLSGVIHVNSGLLLGIVTTGLGVVFQAWAELQEARDSSGKNTGEQLAEKIRKL
jgi:hypothetical protein